jgi:hypothetical protein
MRLMPPMMTIPTSTASSSPKTMAPAELSRKGSTEATCM